MKALTLRNAGATYPKIGEQLGTTEMQARRDVRAAIREVVELPTEEMVLRQRAVLLDITRVNYMAAMGGDKDAQNMLIKCLEHEAKLYGLYAPARVNVGISETDFARQASELLAVVGDAPLRELAGLTGRPNQQKPKVVAPGKGESPPASTTAPGTGMHVVDAEIVDVQDDEDDGEPWSNL